MGGLWRSSWTVSSWMIWLICAATAINVQSDRSQVLHQMGVKLNNDIPSVAVFSVASSSVDLPCNLTGNNAEDKVRLVLWFKNDSAKPIYTYDTRGKSHEDARHWSDDEILKGRAFFRGDLNPGRLVLDNSQAHDEGVYKCRVDFKKAPTRISKVNLEVIIPPEKPVIYDDSNQQVRLKLGPYRIGESVMIKCSCLGGRPSPAITWWRDHHLVDDSYEQVSESKVSNLLSLKRLRREDLDSILTCQASNNNVSVPVSTSVKLDMTFGPTSVRLLGMKQSLSAGVGYDVQCQTIGARPIPKITWFKRGKEIPTTQKDQMSPDGNVTMSTIRLTPSKDDDGSILTCRAGLDHLPDSNMETSWNIRVNYAPTAKLTLGISLKPANIKEGDDVYFECVIKSNPRAHLITWRKDGVALRHDVLKGMIISNQRLVLQNITRSETGTYTCQAKNSEGEGHSNEVTLNIKYAPVCRQGQQLLYGIARHEVSHVSCQVLSNPSSNLTFEWVLNTTSERLDIPQSQFSNSGGTESFVEYIPRMELDYGSLLCWATNNVGRQEIPCIYHLIPAGKPDPVSNCSISNQSHSSFSLDCQSGFEGVLQQIFVMEVIDTEAGYMVANMSSQTPTFSANGIQSGKTFLIKVYSVNDKGHSEPFSITAFTLEAKEAERRIDLRESGLLRTRFTITSILGVLIGVGAALGLVFVSII